MRQLRCNTPCFLFIICILLYIYWNIRNISSPNGMFSTCNFRNFKYIYCTSKIYKPRTTKSNVLIIWVKIDKNLKSNSFVYTWLIVSEFKLKMGKIIFGFTFGFTKYFKNIVLRKIHFWYNTDIEIWAPIHIPNK